MNLLLVGEYKVIVISTTATITTDTSSTTTTSSTISHLTAAASKAAALYKTSEEFKNKLKKNKYSVDVVWMDVSDDVNYIY